jgi:1-acyl-sn-glycerol-3-phosphate acyltransferase
MVLIFPEGTRTRNGELGVFRPGFTTLAVRSGAAILPVAIEGAFAAWPRRHKLPRLGRIRVHYGEPILPAEIAGRDDGELLAEVERRIRQCHARLKLLHGRDQDLRNFKAQLQGRLDRLDHGEGIEIEDEKALRAFCDDVQRRGQNRCEENQVAP